MAVRANGLVQAADDGIESFLASALDEGYRVLRDTAELSTDFDAVEDLVDDFRDTLGDGVSFEGFMALLNRTVASERIAALGRPSTAPEGSVRWFVEENRRLNPEAARSELETVKRTTALQGQVAESVDMAQQADRVATSSVARGDEADLTLAVTNPNPLEPGSADSLREDAQNANSTRSGVQLLLQGTADDRVQRSAETVAILTTLKEQNVQGGFTVKQLSLIAQQLHNQQVREENAWRDAQRQQIQSDLIQVESAGETFTLVGGVLREVASQVRGEN